MLKVYADTEMMGKVLCNLLEIEMSDPSSQLGAWEARVGLGDDERTRSATDRISDLGAAWAADDGVGRGCVERECAAGATAAGQV